MFHWIMRLGGIAFLVVLFTVPSTAECTLPDLRTDLRPDSDGSQRRSMYPLLSQIFSGSMTSTNSSTSI